MSIYDPLDLPDILSMESMYRFFVMNEDWAPWLNEDGVVNGLEYGEFYIPDGWRL